MRRFCIRENRFGGGISRLPILNCTWKENGSNIQVFLALSSADEVTGRKEGKQIHLKGEGLSQGKQVNFTDTISGSGHIADSTGVIGEGLWKLKVFENTGTTRVMPTSGSGTIEEEYDCNNKNVFKVTAPTFSASGGESAVWEHSVTKVQLTLSGCESVNGVEECNIVINSNVGLTWNPQFTPKAIFK